MSKRRGRNPYEDPEDSAYLEGDAHVGSGDHVIFRQQPKRDFKPNPIGFGADMSQHPKYKKTPRKG